MFLPKNNFSGKFAQGISVVEILVALGVLVVVLSFAAPSLTSATAKAELVSAVENLEFSVRMAKLTARQLETDVVMHLETSPREKYHSITFSFPARTEDLQSDALLQDYRFPEGIRVKSDLSSIYFGHNGDVRKASRIMLLSSNDDDINKQLVVE